MKTQGRLWSFYAVAGKAFQLIYFVTRGIHVANPCLLKLFYIGSCARPACRRDFVPSLYVRTGRAIGFTALARHMFCPTGLCAASRFLRRLAETARGFIAKMRAQTSTAQECAAGDMRYGIFLIGVLCVRTVTSHCTTFARMKPWPAMLLATIQAWRRRRVALFDVIRAGTRLKHRRMFAARTSRRPEDATHAQPLYDEKDHWTNSPSPSVTRTTRSFRAMRIDRLRF